MNEGKPLEQDLRPEKWLMKDFGAVKFLELSTAQKKFKTQLRNETRNSKEKRKKKADSERFEDAC